jgi:hypothetical protein
LADDLAAYLHGEPVLADSGTRLRLLRLLWRETRHTEVMARWGRVLMWLAALVFLFCLVFGALRAIGVDERWLYRSLMMAGFASAFVPVWFYRVRAGAPLTALERQLAQVWGGVLTAVCLTGVFRILRPELWRVYPIFLLELGLGFGCTAAILGGSFYLLAILCGLLALVHVLLPEPNVALSGLVFAIGLFVPGWRFARRAKDVTNV